MVDRPEMLGPGGYLLVGGRGGCRARDIRDLLDTLEASYQAVARVESRSIVAWCAQNKGS